MTKSALPLRDSSSPARGPCCDPGGPDESAPASTRLGDCDLGKAVVVVIDDNHSNVLLLQRMLERAGVGQVVGITDSRQAVARIQDLQPDLILLDLHMPHLDGVAILEALRDVTPADSFTPVLVLTADATLDAKQRALSAGAKDFVIKPFDHVEVLLRVKNLLETRALYLALHAHNAELRARLAETAERERQRARDQAQRRRHVQQVLDNEDITMVFQPIVDLVTCRIVGAEALARFPANLGRRPDEWFAEANATGLGNELELLAVRKALAEITDLPEDVYLSVNTSPRTATDPRLATLLTTRHARRLVLELTEHAPVEHYHELLAALAPLRQHGVRIAVDDTGSGYAGLQHILNLTPNIIKLDIQLIRGIDTDPARQALATALVTFSTKIGASVTAEGIETPAEANTLRDLHVPFAQGYHFGRPTSLPLQRPLPPAPAATHTQRARSVLRGA